MQVYISYNHQDAELARSISSRLRQYGHELVIDVDTLTPGEDWRATLTEALKSSDVFVSLLTANSISSSFVLTEIGTARAFMQTSKKMLVIPVVFDDISIPPALNDILAIRAPIRDIDKVVEEIERAIIAFRGRRAAEEKEEIEVKKRVESNAAEFINEAIKSLEKHERSNRQIGVTWYSLGYIALIAGVAIGTYGTAQTANLTDEQWIRFAYIGLKNLIIIGLLIASSKYAFTLGKSYMSEALKNADRIHAISFGKFYLRAYGEKADWSELKEVFQHWNIDKPSTFQTLDTNQFDPKFIEALTEIAKIIKGSKE